jgi:hypothetical protein
VNAEAIAAAAAEADALRVAPRSVPWRAIALVASLAFSIGWTLALGKDVHWDAINYHLYLGFSALYDRFGQDFFAAGPPAYLNPYAYVPLYLMAAAQWHAAAVAVVLAAWQSLTLWLTFEIAHAAGVARAPQSQGVFALLAVAFAAMNPVLLQGLGSTMTDLTTGVLVLGGWLGLVVAVRDGRMRLLALAGALCGAAAALKLSNAVFAMAAAPALLFFPGSVRQRFVAMLAFGVACAAGFVVVALPWSLQLWREFGNPFFPFLNDVFRSPDFTAEPLRYERFIPRGLWEFVARPFQMLVPASHVHTEPRAPDLRYVALLVVGLGLLLLRGRRVVPEAVHPKAAGSARAAAALAVGFVASWAIWLAISGNSRYFLPMACVASVLLALGLQRLHARWKDGTLLAIVAIIGVQAVQFAMATDWKRDGGAWEGPWLRVEVPQRLRDEPQLFLSAGFLTGSAILPYVHPASGMINIAGFNIIAPGYPGAMRAQRLIDANSDRLRLFVPLPPGVRDRATLPGSPDDLRSYVRRLGLKIDPSDCEFVHVQGNLRAERRPEAGNDWKSFIACRLVKAPEERLAYERAVAPVEQAFDRVEDACPNLFHPRRPPTQEHIFLARTYHMGAEMQLFATEGRVKYYYPLRGGDPIDVGSLEDWRAAPQPIDCSRRTQPAIIRVK